MARRRSTFPSLLRVITAVGLAMGLVLPWQGGVPISAQAVAACAAGAGYGGVPTGGTVPALGGNGCVLIAFDDGTGESVETFGYTGAVQSWTVPAGVTRVTFHLLGAGGGAGNAAGGGGGYAAGEYAVTPGVVLEVIVGQGGERQSVSGVNLISGGTERRNARFGGGASGQGDIAYDSTFASGGGRSAVRVFGSSDDLATAGGGGGGGYSGAGGAGGGLTGADGAGAGGGGGTQSAGGAAGGPREPGTAGVKYAGGYAGNVTTGNTGSEGGGGGGGWYGGGGAGDNGGGGGGSSNVSALSNGSTIAGSGSTPGVADLNGYVSTTTTSTSTTTTTTTTTTTIAITTTTASATVTTSVPVTTTMIASTTTLSGQVRADPTVVATTTSTTTSVPDPTVATDNSARPPVTSGSATVFGMPGDGWVRAVSGPDAYRISTSEGIEISLSANAGSGSTNTRGMPVFSLDDTFAVGVRGLRPGSDTSTWLFSTPTLLGRARTDAGGSLTAEYPIDGRVPPGDHTAQLNGIAPDGTLRSVEVKVEIIGATLPGTAGGAGVAGDKSPTPGDGEQRSSTGQNVGLIVAALALMSAGGSRGGSRGRSGEARDEGVQRVEEGGDVAEVGTGFAVRARDGVRDRYSPPRMLRMDLALRRTAAFVSPGAPVFSRIIDDASYLRALSGVMWVLLPVAAAVTGIIAGCGLGSVVMTPPWWVVVTVLVIGTLDSLSGLVYAVVLGVTLAVTGALGSVDSVRGFFGIAVFSFAVPMIAGGIRPFRRQSTGQGDAWDRTVDVVLLALFGAWAGGSMYSALPSLTTYRVPHSGRVGAVELTVICVVVLRWVLENTARSVVPRSLEQIENDSFPEPSRTQRITAGTLRTLLFLFVVAVYIGNNWALWLGGLMFLYPRVVDLYTSRLPNLAWLHRWLPQNLTRTVVMVFVGTWWGNLVGRHFADSPEQMLWVFVCVGVPGHVLGILDWFGRESRGWESTVVSRVLGIAVLLTGFLTVKGYVSL